MKERDCKALRAMRVLGSRALMDLKARDFRGRKVTRELDSKALKAQKAKGLARKMVSFVTHSGRVPRHGYELFDGPTRLGTIASGTASPTVGKNIGTGLVPLAYTAVGSKFEMDVRGSRQPCEVVAGPFYRRAR